MIFPIQLGMSSSHLTFTLTFFRGVGLNHQWGAGDLHVLKGGNHGRINMINTRLEVGSPTHFFRGLGVWRFRLVWLHTKRQTSLGTASVADRPSVFFSLNRSLVATVTRGSTHRFYPWVGYGSIGKVTHTCRLWSFLFWQVKPHILASWLDLTCFFFQVSHVQMISVIDPM